MWCRLTTLFTEVEFRYAVLKLTKTILVASIFIAMNDNEFLFYIVPFSIQIIDKYVDIDTKLSPLETEWQDVVSTIPQEAIVLVSSSKILSCKIPQLTAETSLNFGLLLDLLARYNCSERYDWWTVDNTQVRLL